MLRKLPKKPKRETRFRSQRHLKHVRSHYCVSCDADAPIEAAHLRIGTDGGMGLKPSDFFAVPLCGGSDGSGCHQRQHTIGERTFWREVGKDPLEIIEELIRTSPVRREIEAHRERQ
jgi:hypothetical protein